MNTSEPLNEVQTAVAILTPTLKNMLVTSRSCSSASSSSSSSAPLEGDYLSERPPPRPPPRASGGGCSVSCEEAASEGSHTPAPAG